MFATFSQEFDKVKNAYEKKYVFMTFDNFDTLDYRIWQKYPKVGQTVRIDMLPRNCIHTLPAAKQRVPALAREGTRGSADLVKDVKIPLSLLLIRDAHLVT